MYQLIKDNKKLNAAIVKHGISLLLILLIFSFFVLFHIPKKTTKLNEITYSKQWFKEGYKSVYSSNFGVENKIGVCFIMAAFTEHGGVEHWMMSLVDLINNSDGFYTFGIFVWDLVSDRYMKYLNELNIQILRNRLEVRYCEIIINTAFIPVKDFDQVDILAIHGGRGSEWTRKYSQHSRDYDYIVGVSHDSKNMAHSDDVSRVVFIPTIINENKSCDEKPKLCDNQLLYIGRISSEKRPKLFCEAICSMDNFCGVMIGPIYFDASVFQCGCGKVKYIGSKDDATCYIKNSKAVLVPSENEGGPIVAIESWKEKTPVVMKSTGLATEYPESFLIFDWDNPNYELLNKLLKNEDLLKKITGKSIDLYNREFSRDVSSKKWMNLLNSAKSLLRNKKPSVEIVTDSTRHHVGKVMTFTCMQMSCYLSISFRTKLKCKVLIDSQTKHVTIDGVKRTLNVETIVESVGGDNNKLYIEFSYGDIIVKSYFVS